MAEWLQKQWMSMTIWHLVLMPLSWFFAAITNVRTWLYQSGSFKSYHLNAPVIVVGNINVGGTGKTPLVIWLAEQLKLAGYHPGIISRGYGGGAKCVMGVQSCSDPLEVGDEPVLIATRTACPVYIGSNRIEAGRALLKAYPACDVIVSDDGLQHYRMQRDVEIVVYDSVKGFGNGALLPAGPLREPIRRLKSVDAIVSNGKADVHQQALFDNHMKPIEMQLEATDFYQLNDNHLKCSASAFTQQKILAIAGIGNPNRFFQQLRDFGLHFETQAYPDHHTFQPKDFEQIKADIVLMTEKDAVKCKSFAKPNYWVLPVSAVIEDGLMAIVLNKLNKLR